MSDVQHILPRRERTSHRRRSGTTLIEVVIALGLLALALGSGYGLVAQSAEMMRRARDHYVATTICLGRIERARSVDYTLLPLMAEAGLTVNKDGAADSSGTYRRQTTITPDAPTPGVTRVSVTTWIRNRRTGHFGPEQESMSCIFTTYMLVPQL